MTFASTSGWCQDVHVASSFFRQMSNPNPIEAARSVIGNVRREDDGPLVDNSVFAWTTSVFKRPLTYCTKLPKGSKMARHQASAGYTYIACFTAESILTRRCRWLPPWSSWAVWRSWWARYKTFSLSDDAPILLNSNVWVIKQSRSCGEAIAT